MPPLIAPTLFLCFFSLVSPPILIFYESMLACLLTVAIHQLAFENFITLASLSLHGEINSDLRVGW